MELPQRWAIWLAIEGDLRFASHHDCLRAIKRIVTRAELPVSYSQGFNPQPRLSLASPRPVGVESHGDLLVISLDAPIDSDDLLRRLNANSPEGMTFDKTRQLPTKRPPQPLRMSYTLEVPTDELPALTERIGQLESSPAWEVERRAKAKSRRDRPTVKTVDIRPLIERLVATDDGLEATFVGKDQRWARPGELLELLGLDKTIDLARMVRTEIQYEIEPAQVNDQAG